MVILPVARDKVRHRTHGTLPICTDESEQTPKENCPFWTVATAILIRKELDVEEVRRVQLYYEHDTGTALGVISKTVIQKYVRKGDRDDRIDSNTETREQLIQTRSPDSLFRVRHLCRADSTGSSC